jgi:flavin reductase (DIM6/NTAB) family NADH-FMN oxidoreductase RutF
MTLIQIPFDKLRVRPHDLWKNRWLVLASGDYGAGTFNAMTVAWGGMGEMWNKPFVQVVVRPTRHTHGFMEKFPTFTLCAFPESCRKAMTLLGTRSGRDGDKISESGLTPVPSQKVQAPSFDEAELVIECRKMYWDDFDPRRFIDPAVDSLYPQKDYHRFYFGEVVEIRGIETYSD